MLLMQFLVLLLNSQKGLFSVVLVVWLFFFKQPSKRPNNKETKKDPKQQQKIVAMMSQHNRSVSLFEIILQVNRVNAVLKYN